MISSTVLFTLFFAIVIILWIFALVRQTIGMYGLSSVGWFSLAIAVFIDASATSGLTQGIAVFSLGFGILMLLLTIYEATRFFQEAAEEKKRRIAEEIM